MEPRRESNKRRDESTNTNGFNKKKRLNHAGDTTEKRKEGNPAKKIKANNYPQKKARAEENGNRANKRRNKEEDSMLNIVQEQDLVQKQKRAEERDQVGEPSEQQEAGEVVEEIEEMEEIEDTGEEVENTKGGAHKNVPDNLLLFQYYKAIIPENEFTRFKQSLHTRLHTTFRIGGDDVTSKTFLHRMTHSPSFLALESGIKVGGESIPPPSPIHWYPDLKAWRYSVSGEHIRRAETFKGIHQFLVSAANSGDIWRQEEASMIPPCFLDAQSSHKILDMCAAPGSKTAQIHDMVFGERSDTIPTGCIIANDANHKRCLLLSQRLTKTSSPHLLVTNHDAQHFPLKTGGMRLRFDRILCDVPCSGDGTLRKLPSKAWAGWSTNSAFSLHALQAAIVSRGLELLGLNGRLVYSTCSMNPVENEAVVSTILQKFKGQVELVDVSNEVPGLKRNKGLKTWRVMDENGNWYSKCEEVPAPLRDAILPTMFPKKGLDLSRCVRIFPHTQDTSGFFVSVFKVIKLIEVDKPAAAEARPAKQGKRRSPPPRFTSLWGDGPSNNNPDLVSAISGVYQIGQEFPWRACFARKSEISEKKVRNVLLFSESLRDILQHNKKDAINVVHGGVQLFERTTKEFTSHTNFKPLAASLPYLSPFLGPKRLLTLSHPLDLHLLITSQRLPLSLIQDPTASQALKKLFTGYVVIKFKLNVEEKVQEKGEGEGGADEEKGKKKKGNGKDKQEDEGDKEGMVVCRNGNGSLSLCASSSEVWSHKFLLNYT